jgi:hypothetical protein
MERLHPEDRDRVEEVLKRAVREKGDFEFDYRTVLPDGSIKFLRSVGEALVNPAGELEFIGTTHGRHRLEACRGDGNRYRP